MTTPPPITVILGDLVRVHCQGEMLLLPAADIVTIRSCENYTLINLVEGRTLTVRLPIKTWEAHLPEELFIRTHRTTLINRRRARGYRCVSPKKWMIDVAGAAQPIPVGRIYWRKVKSALDAGSASPLRSDSTPPVA